MPSSTSCQNAKTPSRSPKKPHILSFRLTEEEAARVEAASSRLQVPRSPADACRALALKWATGKVPEPVAPKRMQPRRKPAADTEALARLSGQLGKVGSNVNQLAKVANSSGRTPELRVLLKVADEVADLQRQVKAALLGGADGH